MTVAFHPPPSETPVASRPVPSRWGRDRGFRFGFLVTDQAIYVPAARSGFHLAEGLESRRLPLGGVSRVGLAPARVVTPLTLFYAGALVFFSLVALSFRHSGSGSASGLTAALFYVGVVLFALMRAVLGAPGRLRLTIATAAETTEFTPTSDALPFPPGRRRARAAQLAFVQACAQVGITTVHSGSIPTGSSA